MSEHHCRHCGHTVRLFNYALGPQWMHVDPNASFPTANKGTAWSHCRTAFVAEPDPT